MGPRKGTEHGGALRTRGRVGLGPVLKPNRDGLARPVALADRLLPPGGTGEVLPRLVTAPELKIVKCCLMSLSGWTQLVHLLTSQGTLLPPRLVIMSEVIQISCTRFYVDLIFQLLWVNSQGVIAGLHVEY